MRVEVEIDNLNYTTIERVILDYFDMGSPNTSNIPPKFIDGDSGMYILVGTRKSGTFYISVHSLANGKYGLWASLQGDLHKCE